MHPARLSFIAIALAFAFLPAIARANHFTITLDVSDGTHKQTGKTESEPPKAGEIVVRPVMETKAGAKCTAKFKLTCASKELLKDVLVHFYVVKIGKPGQNPPPLEPKDVVIETAQTMDFAEGTTTSAELEFTPDRAGIYLVRIETQGTAEAKGHEHYAAIDLVVK
ncbi:MAG TPA: hypothetical protein VFE47_25740 [Tepidisphaeraceae bacterium]|jgi:hypothetical protein|nr:hypothetical protein [Tepidisphaeraceae bacterium]